MNTIHIYSDESRHRCERFLLLGALWIKEDSVAILNERISVIRKKYGYARSPEEWIDFKGEFKWTKVSQKHLPLYKEIVDVFFDMISQNNIRFCCMLVDTQAPAVVSRDNIKTDGFYRLLYQLYYHNCRVPGVYKIFPDRITNPTHDVSLAVLHRSLEAGLAKKFAEKVNPQLRPPRYVLQITPQESHAHESIQMVDLIIGAVGYYQNRLFEKDGASAAKCELMKYVFDKFVYSGVFKIEGKHYMVVRSTRLNIWLFKPRNKNGPHE